MENATDRSVAQFIAREHDPARTVSVDLFDDLGQRRALEDQQATPPCRCLCRIDRRAGRAAIGVDCKLFARSDMIQPSALAARSEEHTSELQSLMRISYSVFCLNKKHKRSRLISTNPYATRIHM